MLTQEGRRETGKKEITVPFLRTLYVEMEHGAERSCLFSSDEELNQKLYCTLYIEILPGISCC